MATAQPRFLTLATKTLVSHMLTYFVMGALAFHFLHYRDRFRNAADNQSTCDAGACPADRSRSAVCRSLLSFPRDSLRAPQRMAADCMDADWSRRSGNVRRGSFEGFIYTTVSLPLQVRGYLEIVPQALLLSALLFYWVRHPGKAWLNWVLGLAYAICVFLPILGLLASRR